MNYYRGGMRARAFCKRGHNLSENRIRRIDGYGTRCRQCMRDYGKAYYKANSANYKYDPTKYKYDPTKSRLNKLKTKYGVSQAHYDAMLAKQDGVCAVCKRLQQRKNYRLSIDHDHTTGAVRGLLCSDCNLAIGFLGDSPERAEKLARYLQSHAQAKIPFANSRGPPLKHN